MELDAATKERLANEVELLVRMGKCRKTARQIVWADYLDELQQAEQIMTPTPAPEVPGPEPPAQPVRVVPVVTKTAPSTVKERFFTPDRLAKNKAALNQLMKSMGLGGRKYG